MDAGTISYAWYEAGKHDPAHGLMPMAVGSIPDEARESYARGKDAVRTRRSMFASPDVA